MLELTSYPARQGDSLWIRWGDADAPHHLVIDMGTEKIGHRMRPRLEAIGEQGESLDLLVITHVDADHVGGVLTSLAETDPVPGLEIGDVWFNGFEHLSGGTAANRSELEAMGPAQGERFSSWLRDQPWNEAFARGPVVRTPGEAFPVRTLHDGLTLTILGPTPHRLARFVDTWAETVEEALEKGRLDPDDVSPGLEGMGTDEPPELATEDDLLELATRPQGKDASRANGSSIALLLEYRDVRLLLLGDAFFGDMVDALQELSPDTPLEVDLVKLSHHGSRKSTSRELVEAVRSPLWLFSTDGTRFRHPDPEPAAQVLAFGTATPSTLVFNVRTPFNEWWDNPEWKARFEYSTRYGDVEDGVTILFDGMD